MEEGNYRRGDELSCIRRHRAYPAIFSFSPPFRSAPIIRWKLFLEEPQGSDGPTFTCF